MRAAHPVCASDTGLLVCLVAVAQIFSLFTEISQVITMGLFTHSPGFSGEIYGGQYHARIRLLLHMRVIQSKNGHFDEIVHDLHHPTAGLHS